MPGPSFFVAFAMVVAFASTGRRLARAIGGVPHATASTILFMVLAACAAVPFCLEASGLLALFACVWAAALVSFGAVGRFKRRPVLVANTLSLVFMLACGLVYFGYLSLTGHDVENVSLPEERCLMMAVALVIATLASFALSRILTGAYPESTSADQALGLFYAFGFFGVVYELLDLVPLALGVWFDYLPYFVLGGTVILAGFCGVFAFATANLGAEAFREAENIALERKKRDEEGRQRLYRARAAIDPLTELATRRILEERLEALSQAGQPYSLAFIDLNGLKAVNDEHGHLAGDAYLKAFAHELSAAFAQADVGRWGGDEFLAIGPDEPVGTLAARLDALEPVAQVDGEAVPVRFCYGTTASDECATADEAVRRADAAMYLQKRAPRTGRSA